MRRLARAFAGALTVLRGPLPVWLCLGAAAVLVFASQPYNPGFPSKGHHGWVSAHGLAIMSKATPDHGFLGHTLSLESAEGSAKYYYFDRYPVVFSALVHALIDRDGLSLSQQIMLGRQLFNAVYVGTLIVTYLLLLRLLQSRWRALAVTFLAFSGYYLTHFKDMVHFDQPALFGFMLLTLGIADYELKGRRRLLRCSVLIAVLLGRGYASYALLAAWGLCQSVAAARDQGWHWRDVGKTVLRLEALKVSLLALGLGLSALSYNLLVESAITGNPVSQTGIVKSAVRRLGADASFTAEHASVLAWPQFLSVQGKRAVMAVVPRALSPGWSERKVPDWAWLVVSLAAVVGALRQTDRRRAVVWWVLISAGPLWCLAMRNLTAFHDYTAMFYLGLGLAFYASLVTWVPPRWIGIPLLFSMAVFCATLWSGKAISREQRVANRTTRDFEQILAQLEPGDRYYVVGGHRKLLEHVPFALGFYLRDQVIALGTAAPYALARSRAFRVWRDNRTEQNEHVFLLARDPQR